MKILKNVFTDLPMFLSKNTFTGDINIKKDSTAIKESVKNIILTSIYERPFDTEFGTNLTTSLFENKNDFSFYVENNMATAITRYEPRIALTKIESTFNDKTVNVLIEYKIKNYDIKDNIQISVERIR
jgi:phage baseplate assembly protein W